MSAHTLSSQLVSQSTDKFEIGSVKRKLKHKQNLSHLCSFFPMKLIHFHVASCFFLISLSGIYAIASHEVELNELIPESEYLSGRIFVGSTSNVVAKASNNNEKDASSAPASPLSHVPTTGHALFSKQRLVNRQVGRPNDFEAILNDPSLLVLNRDGIIKRGEKVRHKFDQLRKLL